MSDLITQYREQSEKEMQLVQSVVGEDWNTPRAKLHIAAMLTGRARAIKNLQDELAMEKAVQARLEELLKSWFSLKRNE